MKHLWKTFTFSALSLLVLVGISGCEGPVGPIGPEGPPGRDGNANVFSINYLVLEEDWQEVGEPGQPGFFLAVDLDVPEIDNPVVENGLVLAYYRANDDEPWTALPFTRISHDPEFVETFDFIYDLGFVGLQSMATDLGATRYAGTVRVIVADAIPLGKNPLDLRDYEAVAEVLEITEAQQIQRTAKH